MPIKAPGSIFGRRLRAARQSLGWTQAQLAERLGLTEQNTGAPRVSRYETGLHAPDDDTARELAEALGVPVAYFHATSDALAEAILIFNRLPPARQKKAIAVLKELAGPLPTSKA